MPDPQIGREGIETASPADDEIICGCVNLRVQGLRAVLDAEPTISFEELLGRTKAGGSCTSCLLDLEYYYVTLPRSRSSASVAFRSAGTEAPRSLKRRMYRVLDGLSPLAPFPLTEWMPVVVGNGIEQWVWIANQSLLYEGKECAPDFDIGITVRDSEGRTVHQGTYGVESGTTLRLNVSRFLPSPGRTGGGSSLGIGSVVISRRARRPGFRGAIRPQIQIVSPAGSCAVHSQAPSFPWYGPPEQSDQYFTCLYRPHDERIFFSIVNASQKPLAVKVAYPFDVSGVDGIEPLVHNIEIPPDGARLHEVEMPASLGERCLGRMFSTHWSAADRHKIHVLCATPNLDRFSIDHL